MSPMNVSPVKTASIYLLFLVLAGFGSTRCFSQTVTTTTINYLTSSLSTTACNVFNPSVAVGGKTHESLAGGVTFSSAGIALSTTPSSTTPGGTAYVIDYNFISGNTYNVSIVTAGGDGSMNLSTSIVTSLSSFSTSSTTSCTTDNDVVSYRLTGIGAQTFGLIPSNSQTNVVTGFTVTSSGYSRLVIWATGGNSSLSLDVFNITEVIIKQTAPAPPPASCSLAAPGGLTTSGDGTILNWNAVSGAASYKIVVTDGTTVSNLTSTSNSLGYCPIANGDMVSFKVQSVCSNGVAGGTSGPTSYTYTAVALATPTGLTFTPTSTLSWNAVTDAKDYLVELKDVNAGLSAFTVTGTSVSDPDAELTFNHTYQFRVTAQGCSTSPTSAFTPSFTVLAPCPSPNIANVEPLGSGQANVAWNNVTGANTYNFKFVNSSNTTTFSNISGTLHNGTTFTGIPIGTYTVSIQANCTVGNQSPFVPFGQQVNVSQTGAQAIHFQGTIGISTLSPEASSFKLYPVPASSQVNMIVFAAQNGQADVTILNSAGNVVVRKTVGFIEGQNNYSLGTNELPNGMYVIKLMDGKNTYVQKLMIQK